MRWLDFDDTDLALVGLTVLGVASLLILRQDAASIVMAIVAGVCGLAQGRSRRNREANNLDVVELTPEQKV